MFTVSYNVSQSVCLKTDTLFSFSHFSLPVVDCRKERVLGCLRTFIRCENKVHNPNVFSCFLGKGKITSFTFLDFQTTKESITRKKKGIQWSIVRKKKKDITKHEFEWVLRLLHQPATTTKANNNTKYYVSIIFKCLYAVGQMACVQHDWTFLFRQK